MEKNELRTFTLSYIPENLVKGKHVLQILVKKESYSTYVSLFAPNNFEFEDLKYREGQVIKEKDKPPSFIKTLKGHQTFSLRSTEQTDQDTLLRYKLKAKNSAKMLTKLGGVSLSVIPIILGIIIRVCGKDSISYILDKNVEIELFVIRGSILLPQLQHDPEIKNQLIKVFNPNNIGNDYGVLFRQRLFKYYRSVDDI